MQSKSIPNRPLVFNVDANTINHLMQVGKIKTRRTLSKLFNVNSWNHISKIMRDNTIHDRYANLTEYYLLVPHIIPKDLPKRIYDFLSEETGNKINPRLESYLTLDPDVPFTNYHLMGLKSLMGKSRDTIVRIFSFNEDVTSTSLTTYFSLKEVKLIPFHIVFRLFITIALKYHLLKHRKIQRYLDQFNPQMEYGKYQDLRDKVAAL